MVPVERDDLVVLMEGGYLLLRMGRFDAAREVFDGVSVLAPATEVPFVATGSVFFAQMKYDQAIQHYRKAIALKPDSAFAHAYLGESLFFKGKKDEAVVALEKASAIEPTGKSGDFARALLEAVKNGYVPPGQMTQH
jgi:tetratricopeptide (TPR) repeat protein